MWDSDKNTHEMVVMRMCCRYALGHMDAALCMPYLERPFNETAFLKLLHDERVLLLVYQVLSGELKAYVAPGLLKQLAQKAKEKLNKQLALNAIERELKAAFDAEKITHTFLKGPALNQMLWGRRMMRYSGDLDVLIAPKDIFKANTVFKALHFSPGLSEKKLRFHQRFHRVSTKKDTYYWRESFFLQKIELHWKTYCTEFIIDKNHAELSLLDDAAYALYLCLHAAKHGWSRIIWLVDIIAFIDSKQLDIMQLRLLAKTRHITPVVDEMILLADQWLGIALLDSDGFNRLKARDAWLQKRVAFAKKTDIKDTLWGQLTKRFYMNAFCSSAFRQAGLWAQIFLGTIMMKLSRLP